MLSLSRRAYPPYGGCLTVALSVIPGPSASGRCAASFDALAASRLLSFSSTTTAIHLCHQYTSLRPRRSLPRGLFCIDDRATVTDDSDSDLHVHTFFHVTATGHALIINDENYQLPNPPPSRPFENRNSSPYTFHATHSRQQPLPARSTSRQRNQTSRITTPPRQPRSPCPAS